MTSRSSNLTAYFLTMMEGPEGKAALSGKNIFKLLRQVRPMFRQLLDKSGAAAQNSEAIIYHPKAIAGPHIAERLSIPGFLAHPVPWFALTQKFPNPVLPFTDLGGTLNRWSWSLNKFISGPFGSLVKAWRKDLLGLLPAWSDLVRDGQPVPLLYSYIPRIVPIPDDLDQSVTVMGYRFLDPAAPRRPPQLGASFRSARSSGRAGKKVAQRSHSAKKTMLFGSNTLLD